MNPVRRPAHAAWIVALLAAGAAGAAPVPGDFAWQWPLSTPGEGAVSELSLEAPVYGVLQRDDLGDLAVFDARDQPLLLAPAPMPSRQRGEAAHAEDAPWFQLPATGDDPAEAIRLELERGEDGRLRRLGTRIEPTVGEPAAALLVDLSQRRGAVEAVEIQPAALPAVGLDARVRVLASDDLRAWRVIASGLPLLALSRDGFELTRTRLAFPPTAADYLRLEREDGDGSLPVAGLRVVPARDLVPLPERERSLVAGQPVADAPGVFEFEGPGPLPTSAVQLRPASDRGVVRVQLSSRDSRDDPWLRHGELVAFSLDGDGPGNLPLEMRGIVRDRYWRIATEPPLAEPPRLELHWYPDRFLVGHGQPPMRLAAGSARVDAGALQRGDFGSVLARSRQQFGADWEPAAMQLGARAALGGPSVLTPAPVPIPWRQVLLWLVLVGGVLVLLALVLRLLRSPPPPR